MTRVNVGIPVNRLPRLVLLAEHREIKRIPNHLLKYGYSGNAPKHFCLGKGHVVFMVTKGEYTYNRYKQLYEECVRRGYNVTDYSGAWESYKLYPRLWKNYRPRKADRQLILKRFKEKGHKLL